MDDSFAEKQKHLRAAKPVCTVNTNTVKNESFTWRAVIVSIEFLFDFEVP